MKYCFDRETLVLIITSLVFSKMLYCSTVWSNTSSKNIQKLQLIQNFACKIICGARKYDHVTPLLDELNWLSVSKMLKFRDAVMAYKCANNLAPEYLCAKFKKRSSVHNRTTRNPKVGNPIIQVSHRPTDLRLQSSIPVEHVRRRPEKCYNCKGL